ncbi:MAG TPA: hypothetical protein DEP46_07565 [Blastocatellia bacterium]|nr:hypothetical protein [Blastocatellia bacterium]
MTSDSQKIRNEYFNMMTALADSVVEMPDAEIEEEIKEDGDKTEETRNVLLNSVRLAKQHALNEARKQYTSDLLAFQKLTLELPPTPGEKRDLLQSMLGSISQSQQLALTGQFREFEKLADEDLDGILLQLFALQSVITEEDESGQP